MVFESCLLLVLTLYDCQLGVLTVKQYGLLEAVFSSIMRGYQSKADKFELGQLATVSFPCS